MSSLTTFGTDEESENTAPTGRDDGLGELIHLYYNELSERTALHPGLKIYAPEGGSVEGFFRLYPLLSFNS